MSDTAAIIGTVPPVASDSEIADRLEEKMFGTTTEEIEDAEIIADDKLELEMEEEGKKVDDEVEDEDEDNLASYLGISDDQVVENEDGTISILTKIDGKSESLPLSKILEGYQYDKHNTQTSMKLSADRKEFETLRTTAATEIQKNIQSSMFVSESLEQDLLAEYNAINWDMPRQSDATQFNELKAEFSERATKVNALKEKASAAGKQWMEQNDARQAEDQKANIAEQRELMIQAYPEFIVPEKYEAAMTSAIKFMEETYGVTQEDVDQITDSRLVRIILDAEKFHKGKTELAKGKGEKQLPKFSKPGRRKAGVGTTKARAAKALKAAAKATGSSKDIANLLESRM